MEFKIKSYSKGELAQLYSPNLTENAARAKLMKWIAMQPALVKQLRSLGFTRNSKVLTPLMVRYIVDAIGEP
jgi:hypothetical protein